MQKLGEIPTDRVNERASAEFWISRHFLLPTSASFDVNADVKRDKGFGAVWPNWVIYWTLGLYSKPFATINLPKSPTFLGNFCKGVQIFNFSSNIIFGQLLWTFVDFYWSHCSEAIFPFLKDYFSWRTAST